MCGSSSQTLSLKLICLTCFFIMTVDTIMLFQTINQYYMYQVRAYYEVFVQCYEPQLLMRMVFTCYAINSAGLCFVLTFALSCLSSDESIEKVAMALFTYTYITFGPLLLIFSIYGMLFIQSLMFTCELTHISNTFNFMDVMIVVGCALFSGFLTLFFSV